jgi:predicted RNA-binding protein YlqC (UPF0109 family)
LNHYHFLTEETVVVSNIDQQFIEYVVKSLVGNPDAVQVSRRIDEKGVLLELTVDPDDLGRVIGKRGATAQSLRTLLRALGTKNDARYNLKIVDNGTGGTVSDDDYVAGTTTTDAPAPKKETKAAAAEEPDEEVEVDTPAPEEDATSDRLKQARQELAELDDLDV